MDRRQELIDKHAARTGLRGKVNAYCISCIYDQSNRGTWRQQVQECSVTSCPLYSVRPLMDKRAKNDREPVFGLEDNLYRSA
jgi:hypothetical protein